MNAVSNAKYTLRSVSRNVATVAVNSKIELVPMEGMTGKIAGTQTGTMTIDTKTGITLTSVISKNLKGNLSAQGVDMTMELITKTSISTKEVK
jgi:hypothetical protein